MRQLESFFWGIIAALGALLVQLVFFIGLTASSATSVETSFSQLFILPHFIILAASIEEMLKYLVISKRVELYSLEKSYIVNSLFVGFGFIATEAWLLMNAGTLPSNQILAELAIVHLGTAGIIGYLVATKNPKKISTFLYTIFIVTLFHASYNFLIQHRGHYQNYIIFFLLALLVSINLLNLLRISHKLAQD